MDHYRSAAATDISSTMRIFSRPNGADGYFYGCPGLSSPHCPVCACLLACLIVAPRKGCDEPKILSYAISPFCPTSADGLHLLMIWAASGNERRRIFEKHIYPGLGTRQIDEIGRPDVVRLLDKVEDRHGPARRRRYRPGLACDARRGAIRC